MKMQLHGITLVLFIVPLLAGVASLGGCGGPTDEALSNAVDEPSERSRPTPREQVPPPVEVDDRTANASDPSDQDDDEPVILDEPPAEGGPAFPAPPTP